MSSTSSYSNYKFNITPFLLHPDWSVYSATLITIYRNQKSIPPDRLLTMVQNQKLNTFSTINTNESSGKLPKNPIVSAATKTKTYQNILVTLILHKCLNKLVEKKPLPSQRLDFRPFRQKHETGNPTPSSPSPSPPPPAFTIFADLFQERNLYAIDRLRELWWD